MSRGPWKVSTRLPRADAKPPMVDKNFPDAVKRAIEALDHAEFVERVPALQGQAAEYEKMDCSTLGYGKERGVGFDKLNERGARILKFPHHSKVIACARELAGRGDSHLREPGGKLTVDLRTARRKLKDALEIFDNRVNFRDADVKWKDGKGVSLSSILESRAEAKMWRKIVTELETLGRIEKHNEHAIARHQDLAAGIIRREFRRRREVRRV